MIVKLLIIEIKFRTINHKITANFIQDRTQLIFSNPGIVNIVNIKIRNTMNEHNNSEYTLILL